MKIIASMSLFAKRALLAFLLLSLTLAHAYPSLGQNAPTTPATGQSEQNNRSEVSAVGSAATETGSLSQRDLIEQAFHEIEIEARRLDRLIANGEILGGIVCSVILAVSVLISVLAFRSISELKRELQSSVEVHVSQSLRKQAQIADDFKKLYESLKEADGRWKKIKESVEGLQEFVKISETTEADAWGAYMAIKRIADKPGHTQEDRRIARVYLQKLIDLGTQGRVDPTVLFNASSSASELDFDLEALQLATLCVHWDAKPSHILRKSRLEDVFGARYVLTGVKLERQKVKESVVRKEAWARALKEVQQLQLQQCELVLSEAWNIAVRNREGGYIDQLIDTMEKCGAETKDQELRPSYWYAILAQLYAHRGRAGWRKDYEAARQKAKELLEQESPAATWYGSTIKELQKTEQLIESSSASSVAEEMGFARWRERSQG